MSEAKDEEHLKLIKLFHYAFSLVSSMLSCFPLLYLFAGVLALLVEPEQDSFLCWMLIVFGGVSFLLGQAFSFSILYSGRQIAKREKHKFSFVMAGVLCFFMPFGTILGIFTIVVLNRQSVKELY